MPTTPSKAPRAPRVPAPNPNEERPDNCYCSALPRGSGPCLPCYWRPLRLAEASRQRSNPARVFCSIIVVHRLSQAQVPAILNHARALPQRDGHARPAFAGSAEGGERNLVIFDAGDMLHDGFAVERPGVNAKSEVRSRCHLQRERTFLRGFSEIGSSADPSWAAGAALSTLPCMA